MNKRIIELAVHDRISSCIESKREPEKMRAKRQRKREKERRETGHCMKPGKIGFDVHDGI